MGATQFSVVATGDTAADAFSSARQEALWEHGHGGYTGTIAEKTDFTVFDLPERVGRKDFFEALRNTDGDDGYFHQLVDWLGTDVALNLFRTYDNKWGPAVAFSVPLKMDDGTTAPRWLFCGWASE